MTILDEIQAGIARLADEAGSSVVGIGQRWGVGSGIVLGENRVLTNAHNVRGSKVTVTFADGHTAEGTVAGADIDGDLAVVGVETGQAPVLPWATDAPAIAIAPAHVARRLRRAVGLPEADGLLIREVGENSPAARAGLARGDLIVAVGGQPVGGVDDLSGALRAAAPGGTVDLTVLRGTEERAVHVVLGETGEAATEA